jgi:hypothetical protein
MFLFGLLAFFAVNEFFLGLRIGSTRPDSESGCRGRRTRRPRIRLLYPRCQTGDYGYLGSAGVPPAAFGVPPNALRGSTYGVACVNR